MDMSTKLIAAALAVLPILGVGIGLGNFFSSWLNAIARNPDVSGELFSRGIIGAAMIELLGLLSFILALLILFK